MKDQNPTITTGLNAVSPQEFALALRAHAKGIAPENPPTRSVLERLAPHRTVLIQLRKEGYTHAQLVSFLSDPKFGMKVSVQTLRRLLQRSARKSASTHASGVIKYSPEGTKS